MTRHFTIAVLLGTLSCGQAPQEEALDEPVVEPAAPAEDAADTANPLVEGDGGGP